MKHSATLIYGRVVLQHGSGRPGTSDLRFIVRDAHGRQDLACHFAVFFGSFLSMEAEIDGKLPSNSS